MTKLYTVVPQAALEDIFANGLLPLIKQGYMRTEEEAAELFLDRWTARMGREELRDALYQTAAAAVHNVYAFETLDQAQQWATAEPGMVILEISGDVVEYFGEDYENADGEEGAKCYPFGEVAPEYLSVVGG